MHIINLTNRRVKLRLDRHIAELSPIGCKIDLSTVPEISDVWYVLPTLDGYLRHDVVGISNSGVATVPSHHKGFISIDSRFPFMCQVRFITEQLLRKLNR